MSRKFSSFIDSGPVMHLVILKHYNPLPSVYKSAGAIEIVEQKPNEK